MSVGLVVRMHQRSLLHDEATVWSSTNTQQLLPHSVKLLLSRCCSHVGVIDSLRIFIGSRHVVTIALP